MRRFYEITFEEIQKVNKKSLRSYAYTVITLILVAQVPNPTHYTRNPSSASILLGLNAKP